ncbi:type II secretion system F family protein [Nocardioides sp. CFH 31398]|uniref:type II secretion system F family protein n=1 Tax=Nocardioides sp. CFH 31398 TaxID=2919579 RepID=UPI001F05584F|nr:type II secretion system F family protein [Nocardioides sp. CFH 31398]MCH1868222.1 type II secretion system F family protein [Nocardioides sp. CFH 31398]
MAVLVVGVVLLVVSLVLLALATRPESSGVARSLALVEAMGGPPKVMTDELDVPFAKRVAGPLRARTLVLGRRLVGADGPAKLRRKLERAGASTGWDPERVMSAKVIAGAAGLVVSLLLGLVWGPGPVVLLLVVTGGAVVGFLGPDLWLYQRAYDREERIRNELADAVDLLTISVESGLGFDAALQQVASNTEGPLAEEFSRVLREMQLGSGRGPALRALGERSDLDDLKSFVSALVQADSFGIPVGQVLRVQTAEMRVKRRQRAEEKAQQLPVKITVPLIFCILPCLFIAVLGPAAITIMEGGLA